jgi:tubulin polyglutamylase TTLL11
VNKDKGETSTSKTKPGDGSAGEGSKRKLSTVLGYMQAQGYNVAKIRAQIDDLVVKTVLALMPEILVNCAFDVALGGAQKLAYFQIIGFDILLTDKLRPVLLEVNCNPSLRVDYEIETEDGGKCFIPSLIDEEIKKPLVMETLRLIAPRKKLEIM